MDLRVFDETSLVIALRALRGVALAKGPVTGAERSVLEIVASLHERDVDLDALLPITPAEVAGALNEPHPRKRLVQLALVMAMTDGDPTEAQEAAVRALAASLGVDEPGLKLLGDLVRDHAVLVRLDVMRRVVPAALGNASLATGLRTAAGVLVGASTDPQVAWRYKSLGLLPAGTLGRAFWEHCTARQFAFPGERGGFPERGVFHDFAHVLSGYDTDPAGEIQQGAFQAGNRRHDGFAFLLFVLVQFHLGIRTTPVAKSQKGFFAPTIVLGAVARGAACKVDLTDGWDFWSVVDRPLDELRRDYGIAPLSRAVVSTAHLAPV
jgi:hypothetical protein